MNLFKASVFFLFYFLTLTIINAQTIVQVNGVQNNVPIKEVVLRVDRGGANESVVTQTEQGLSNPIPIDSRVEVESILLENGERILATSRFPKVKSASPLLGSNINAPGIRVVEYNHSEESQHISHANNLTQFLESLADVVSIPDLRSYWDISGNEILNENAPFVDIIYSNQIPQSGYVLISERNGNSTMDLVALDENGEVIEDAARISFVAQFDWNTGVNHQINVPEQKQWLTVFSPELFNTETPIFGFRVFDVLESDGKIIFFARDLSATPDNLCPVFASVGSENAGNIFENDEIDGAALNPQDINLSVFDDQNVLSLGFISLDQDPNSPNFGNISVSPDAAPGIYNFEYEIEDKLDGRTDRTEVTVRIIEFLELEDNVYCEGVSANELFISTNRIAGFTYNWYVNQINSTEGGQLLVEETSPRFTPPTDQEGVSYYYVVVTNDCGESLTSTVAEIVTRSTEAPISAGNITECALESLQTLNANDAISIPDGTEIVWYLSPSGDDRVSNPIFNELGSITYYAEAINFDSGCPSVNRTPVTLTLNDCRLDIVKSVDQLEIDSPTILNFRIEVTNPGTVGATNVVVTDPLTNDNTPLELTSGDTNSDGILDLNETWVYQTSYNVTQDLIDQGLDIVNTAFVNADDTGTASSSSTTVIVQNSNISLSKIADKEVVKEAGEVITYTLTVTNIGNTTLTNVTIKDAMIGIDENVGTLAPGESKSISATYTVTLEDEIAQVPIVNEATVSGELNSGGSVDGEDQVSVPVICDDRTRISGLVFNASNGEPLAGVPVTLIPQGDTSGQILLQVTKEDGKYCFTDIEPGDYLVQVQDANLNSVRNLYPVESSLFFASIENCNFLTNDFGYEAYDGNVIGDFVWYDLNGNGIQDEWFDANDDNEVTLNVPDANGYVDFDDWEWIDFNGDGRFDGPENEGEVRKAGFGNPNSANIIVTGPNGYRNEVIIGILGNYRTRPAELGDYTVELVFDENFELEAEAIGKSGRVKVIPNYSGRVKSDPIIQCGVTTTNPIELTFSQESRVRLDVDFGVRCHEVQKPRPIIANDDDLGEYRLSHDGMIGNILENDLLDGAIPNIDEVDFVFTDLDGIIGLMINPNGELSLVPGLNEAREYRLSYLLSEVLDPENNDDAFVTFRLLDDDVDLSVTKTSFGIEIFEGDEFEYEIVVRNNGEIDATEVEIVDDLPNGVSYVNSTVNSNSSVVPATVDVSGNRITWSVPVLPAASTLIIKVLVKAEPLSNDNELTITNVVTVSSSEEESVPEDNAATDTNVIKPFFIPNVITPDGDSLNDKFVIQGLGKFPSNEIVIINRFGDHVFERINYQNDWSAEGLPAGTYYYVLVGTDTQGRSHDFKGWVQVIK